MTEEKNTTDNEQPSKKKTRIRPGEQGGSGKKSVNETNHTFGRGSKIPFDKVEEMYIAYTKKQTAASISEATGVAEKTCQKYINKGDKSRGLKSFKQRSADRRERQDRHIAINLAKVENEMLEATAAMLTVVRYELNCLAQRIKKKENIGIDPHKIPGMLKDLNGLIRYAKGDSDTKVEIEDKYKNWSLEEMTTYLHQGILPEHAKYDKNAPRFNN